MRIGTPDDGNAAAGKTQRIAYDTLAEGFGRGFNGPILVVVDVPAAADRSAVDRVHDALRGRPRRRRRDRADLQRRARHRGAHRQPDHRPAGRADRRTRAPPPLRRAPRHRGRHQRQGDAHRSSDGDRPRRPPHAPAADLHRRRRGDVVRAADDRVPLGARPAQGRRDEPAVDRRRLRRGRRRVPVGLGQGAHRSRSTPFRSTRSCR